MGPTVLTFGSVLESERKRLKPFRRALCREEREAFDRLFDRAKIHTRAGVYMAHSWPMKTILLSFRLENGKTIDDFLERIKEKESSGDRFHQRGRFP